MAALAAGLILSASACGGGGQPAPTAPTARATGGPRAVLAMIAASSITSQGVPVDPAFTFSPGQPRITIIAVLGKVPRAPLTFTWYEVISGGSKRLFSHTLPVAACDRAYSVGKDPGPLATGTYTVTASVAGQTAAVSVAVAQPGQSPSAIQQAAVSPAGEPPADGGGGVFAPPAPAPGQPSTVLCVGAVDTGCYADPGTSVAPSGDAVYVVMMGVGHRGDLFDIDVSTEHTLVSIGRFSVNGGITDSAAFTPCSLSGGSDLPGARYTVTAAVHNGQRTLSARQATIVLGDDTQAPRVNVVSMPARGSKVTPGDKIRLQVTATETNLVTWQTGVKFIQVIGPEGLVGDSGAPYGGVARSCAQKSWTQTFTATYTVPSHPAAIIRLCAIAEDFAGNQDFQCGVFYTGKVWRGTVSGTATVIYHDAGGTRGPYTGRYDGTLTLAESPDGRVTGHAQVSASGCFGKPATSISFDVAGPDSGRQLRLQLVPGSFRIDGTNCGFGLGWSPPPPAESFSSTAAVIPITGPGAAQARWQVIAKAATGQWTIQYHVDLTCPDCRAAGQPAV